MNLLVTGAWQQAKDYIPQLERMGHQVYFLQYEKDELPCDYSWAEGVICNGLFLYHPIERFTSLRYIQVTSAGLDRVPLEYISEKKIELHNARGVYSIPMAEFAIGGVLQLYKQFSFFGRNQEKHIWEKNRHLQELYGKTVCIVGCGSVGTECAKRFQAFGCRVIGIATSNREQLYFDIIKSMDALDEILPEADILILAIPLNDSTVNIISSERIELMKSTAVIVNIARGAVIEQEKLAEALYRRRIWGAVLDVFEDEPLLENSNLWNCPNTILTPHNSFVGENNQERLNNSILSTLEKR